LRHCSRLRRLDLSYNKYKELPVHKLPEEKRAEKLALEREREANRRELAASAAAGGNASTPMAHSTMSGMGTPSNGDKHSPALTPNAPPSSTTTAAAGVATSMGASSMATTSVGTELSQHHASITVTAPMSRSTATGSMSSLTSVSSVGSHTTTNGSSHVTANGTSTATGTSIDNERERQLDEIERKEREFLTRLPSLVTNNIGMGTPLKLNDNNNDRSAAWLESRPETKTKGNTPLFGGSRLVGADDRLDLPWRDPREERERAEHDSVCHLFTSSFTTHYHIRCNNGYPHK
jgi:hypothetical protein